MEKEIFDTKEKQDEREKDFVQSPKRIAAIEAIITEVVDDICNRLENDKWQDFYWGDHTAHIVFDTYYRAEYTYMSDSVQFWVANGVDFLKFYEHAYFGDVLPKDIRARLWEILNIAKQAKKANLPYKEYLKRKDDAKVQFAITKAEEIAKAQAVLEKYKD